MENKEPLTVFEAENLLVKFRTLQGIGAHIRYMLSRKYGDLTVGEIRRKLVSQRGSQASRVSQESHALINLGEVEEYLRKNSSLTGLSKKINVPLVTSRNGLAQKYGSLTMQEIKESLGILPRGTNKDRLTHAKELYDQHGTLEAVGKEMGCTKERVRQLLAKGVQRGFFEHEPRGAKSLRDLLDSISKESLLRSIKKNIKAELICKNLNISQAQLFKLLDHYEIHLGEYQKLERMNRYLKRYQEMVENLGYHPVTTVMQTRSEWRSVWAGIRRHWGSMERFRSRIVVHFLRLTDFSFLFYQSHA